MSSASCIDRCISKIRKHLIFHHIFFLLHSGFPQSFLHICLIYPPEIIQCHSRIRRLLQYEMRIPFLCFLLCLKPSLLGFLLGPRPVCPPILDMPCTVWISLCTTAHALTSLAPPYHFSRKYSTGILPAIVRKPFPASSLFISRKIL